MSQAQAAFIAAVCLSLAGVVCSQPVGCKLDVNCPVGFYCDTDALFCRECLRCEDLKREPLPSLATCIKSVVECGPCNKGLVEDHRGDVNAQCVPRSADDDDSFPMYGWVLIALLCLIVLLTFFGGIVWYVLKHPDTLKVLASTSTSMQSRCETVVPPTAPDQPPPYRALYTAVQPLSPSPTPGVASFPSSPPYNQDSDYQSNDEETSLPFIKQPVGGAWPSRESAGSQAARVYNNPAYVRGANPPAGYESASAHVRDPKPPEDDEETMESTWTPSSSDQNDNTNSASGSSADGGVSSGPQLPALLAAARTTTLVRAPDNALQPYVRQDPNNNGSRGSSEGASIRGEGDANANPANGGSSFIINVIQNINTLPQRSDSGH